MAKITQKIKDNKMMSLFILIVFLVVASVVTEFIGGDASWIHRAIASLMAAFTGLSF